MKLRALIIAGWVGLLAGCATTPQIKLTVPPLPPQQDVMSFATSPKVASSSIIPIIPTTIVTWDGITNLNGLSMIDSLQHSDDLKNWVNIAQIPVSTNSSMIIITNITSPSYFRVMRSLDTP